MIRIKLQLRPVYTLVTYHQLLQISTYTTCLRDRSLVKWSMSRDIARRILTTLTLCDARYSHWSNFATLDQTMLFFRFRFQSNGTADCRYRALAGSSFRVSKGTSRRSPTELAVLNPAALLVNNTGHGGITLAIEVHAEAERCL